VLRYAVYASKSALGAGAAAELPWVTYEPSMSDLPQARWLGETIATEAGGPPQVAVNDADAILSCVRSGIGKSLLPEVIGTADPGLVRLEGYSDLPARELWLLMHPDMRAFKRAVAVVDWLKAATRALR